MAKTFTRIGREIIMAVKESGPDPDSNAKLRAIIQNAKAANMPKENIERAIKKASEKNIENYKEILLEGYAPNGIAILVEAATDNNNRTVANIRSYFNKCDGTLATSGSVEFLFNHLCHFQIKDNDFDLEELELELIDFGVIDLSKEDDLVNISGKFEDFGLIQSELENKKIDIISSEFDREALTLKELDIEDKAKVEKLINMIDEDEDVQNVYHNMKNY